MKKAIIAVPYLKGMGGTETVIKNFAEALDVKNSTITGLIIIVGKTQSIPPDNASESPAPIAADIIA